MNLWPFFVLAPALVVTLRKLPSAGTWLGTLVASGLVWACLHYLMWRWMNGHDGRLLAMALGVQTIEAGFHDTYYVVADLRPSLFAMLPCLFIGLLLLLPWHPGHAPLDFVLFWATALLWVLRDNLPAFLRPRMPRTYIDYPEYVGLQAQWINLITILIVVTVILAALRPLWMGWQREGGRN